MEQTHLAGPVRTSERISAIDILRGVALLGILVINIDFFMYPEHIFFNPSLIGGFEGLDQLVWRLKYWFFSQKMMSIFSMLFGAGLVLMMTRMEHAGREFKPFYLRRTFWLLVFGLLHAYLFWSGDILFPYAIGGFVIFIFRRKSPKTLILVASALFLIGILFQAGAGTMIGFVRDTAREAMQIEAEGGTPDPMQSEMIKAYQDMRKGFNPTEEDIERAVTTFSDGPIGKLFATRAMESLTMQTQGFFFMIFWQVTGLMMLGMALLKMDIITGRRSGKFYGLLALICLAVGLPMCIYGTERMIATDFDVVTTFTSSWPIMTIGSIITALGYIGLIMLFARSGFGATLKKSLAAVGRTALSNYFLHTLVFTTIFYCYGLGLYGQINRAPLMLFVLGMWILQLIISPIWLKHYRFGPAEWLWRSLTYKKKQPMRLEKKAETV